LDYTNKYSLKFRFNLLAGKLKMTDKIEDSTSTHLRNIKIFCFAGFGGTAPMLLDLVSSLNQMAKGVEVVLYVPIYLASVCIAFIIGGIVGFAVCCQDDNLTRPLQALMTGISAPALIFGALATNQPAVKSTMTATGYDQDISWIKAPSNKEVNFESFSIFASAYAQEMTEPTIKVDENSHTDEPHEFMKIMIESGTKIKTAVPISLVDMNNDIQETYLLIPGKSIEIDRSKIKYITLEWAQPLARGENAEHKRINIADLSSNDIKLEPSYQVKTTKIRKCRELFFWKQECRYIPKNEYTLKDLNPVAIEKEKIRNRVDNLPQIRLFL
jgi:hypothetical protein